MFCGGELARLVGTWLAVVAMFLLGLGMMLGFVFSHLFD
jgi:hypothetical protein